MDGVGAGALRGARSVRPTARSWSPARPARASRRPSTRRFRTLNDVEKNIITIEDPVEYRLDGINQINVNRKAGLDFATGLRSILRADPDIVMVGEIRDGETARIAIEAALTGHMMLTHAAHERRARGDHPPDQDGDRGIPDRLRGRLRRRPAPRPQALHALQAAHDRAAGGAGRRRRSGSAASSRPTSRSVARAATRAATEAGSASTR